MHSFLLRNAKILITSCIFFLLILVPIIIQKNLYYVGGDDTRLYYIYPAKFLENLSLTVISDNSLGGANTGYYPTSQMAPFLYVVLFLKFVFPFINTQNLLYGLNYAFGFLFFYLFLGIWLPAKTKLQYAILVIASIFYLFSPFFLGTLYKHHLLAIYLVSVMPAMLYLFVRGVQKNSAVYTISAVTIFSIFSATLNTFPHWIPIFITSLPLILWTFFENKKAFLMQSLIFCVFGVLLNFHWLYHLINSQFFIKGLSSTFEFYSSADFVDANIRGILGSAMLFSPLSVVFMTMDRLFLQNFSIMHLLNGVFLLVIIVGGFVLSKIQNSNQKKIYAIALFSFLISWFLFSPNLGKWGPNLFVWLSTNLPFMTMFRNMYDKFALPLAFFFALSFGISLLTIEKVVAKKKVVGIFLVLFTFLILFNAAPLFRQKKLSEGTVATVAGTFNDDFIALTTYLNHLDNASRILWIPMTAPNYVSVEDKYLTGHYYSGLSPLRIFTGRGDYAGRFSFMIPGQNMGDSYLELIKNKKYEEFGKALQKMNARYIVTDNQNLPFDMRSFLYDADGKYLAFQSNEFKESLIGEKVSDFGERYSLYEVKKEYMSDRLFLTNNINLFPEELSGISYKKVSSNEYTIHIDNLTDTKYLVFIDPYYKNWVLSLSSNGKSISLSLTDEVAYGWANAWKINPEVIKSLLEEEDPLNNSFTLNLYFEPARINKILYPLSMVSYGVVGLYILLYSFIAIKHKWQK